MARRQSRNVVLVTMCAGYFLVLLDVTIVNVALPHIGAGLHTGVSGLQWVVDGYAIALASLMLGGGTAGDRHGHKRIVLAGLAVFGLASLGCGLSTSAAMLVGFRVLQGVGAALMLPGTLAVISTAFPEPGEQARAIGLWAGIGSVALPAGPLLGGALTQLVGWRAVFWVNVPVVLLAGAVAARVVQETVEPGARRLDVAGALLGAVTLALTTFAFIAAGHGGAETSVAAAGFAAAAAAAAFVAVERRQPQPMLPLALFRRPQFSTANLIAGAMNLGTLGLLFVLTLYLQDVRHRSALSAGAALLPLFTPLSLLAPLGGRLTARAGARRPIAVGLVLAAIGVGLLALVGHRTGYGLLLAALLLWGVGLALLTPAVVAAAIAAVPGDRAGLASAVNNTARQASGAVGIAALGALAGSPTDAGFLGGFHGCALGVAGLFAAAGVLSLRLIPDRRRG